MPKLTKITLNCPEGFTYHSWQRLVAVGDDGEPYNSAVVEAFNGDDRFINDDPEDRLFLADDSSCFFCISGESFGLSDFAEAVEERLNRDRADKVEVVAGQDGYEDRV